MKTITTTVYDFDELDDKAKEKARDWYRQCPGMGESSWEWVTYDASTIGLKIKTLDDHRANDGEFIEDALYTANKILELHGPNCETRQDAEKYLPSLKSENEVDRENAEHEFLFDLLEDYRIMLNKDIEYEYSDEAVDETIRANEYTFTADGQREG